MRLLIESISLERHFATIKYRNRTKVHTKSLGYNYLSNSFCYRLRTPNEYAKMFLNAAIADKRYIVDETVLVNTVKRLPCDNCGAPALGVTLTKKSTAGGGVRFEYYCMVSGIFLSILTVTCDYKNTHAQLTCSISLSKLCVYQPLT